MTVSYFYRKPVFLYSIERVFDTVQSAMPKSVVARNVYCRYSRGILGRVRNMLDARRQQSDVNHITGEVHYLAMLLNRRRTVLTIHDCGTLRRMSGWRRELARLFWFEWPTRRATIVTVISENTKLELLRHTACPEAKVSVIPDPLPPGFTPSKKAFNNTEPRLLQVGALENKNLERVAAALSGIHCHLTIVGRLSTDQVSVLEANGICYSVLSDISDADLLEVYRGADVILFCSTYEGFGMPIIEGNGIGRPVVTSDIEPLRSIANGAACLVNPYDTVSIRAGIQRVLCDRAYREDLVTRGYANVARFDATVVANRYLEIYQRLLTPVGSCE